MNMYQSGELEMVMQQFEKTLKSAPIYVGGTAERAEKEFVEQPSGSPQKRYRNNNYYNNGNVNQLFVMYLHGYSLGKLEGRA